MLRFFCTMKFDKVYYEVQSVRRCQAKSLSLHTAQQGVGTIVERGGEEIDIASLTQLELLAQLCHRGRKIAYGEVGLLNATQDALETLLAEVAHSLYAKLPAGKALQGMLAHKEIAARMEFRESVSPT